MKKTVFLGMFLAVSMSMQAKQVTIQTKNTDIKAMNDLDKRRGAAGLLA